MKEINGYFVPEEVLELVKSGNKLEAICRFREFHHVNWEVSRMIIEITAYEISIRSPRVYGIQKDQNSV